MVILHASTPRRSICFEFNHRVNKMGRQDLTIEVLNLSPKLTLSDLNTFFSYCGTVDKIQLRKTKYKSQSALVTFRQPYAFQTALLLNGATFAGQPIRVLPSEDVVIPITNPNKYIDTTQVLPPSQFFGNTKHEGHDLFPAVQAAVQDAASKGIKMLNKAKDEIEENFKLPVKGRTLVDRTTLAINGYVSSSATWFSGVLDKASKHVSATGTNKRDNPNSRKQK